MKTTLYFIAFFCLCFEIIAQDTQEPTDSEKRLDTFTDAKRHELSLDVTAVLILPAFQPRYEYILGRYSGVGVDLFLDLSDNNTDYSDIEKFSITPFYRQYFFSKEDYGARGFYAEGFLKAYTYEDREYDAFFTNQDVNEDTYFETALGVSIGWKWVSNSGFMIDLGFGIGRNLGFSGQSDYDRVSVIPRGGVHFGWRF
jgi:hypothetical protein